jgi:hypothetical protein
VKIDWSALGAVLLVSLAAVVVLTGAFSLGVQGLSRHAVAKEGGGAGTAGLATAVLSFAVCAAVVGYGIFLIVA